MRGFDFLRDPQTEAWVAHIKRDLRPAGGPTFVEATLLGALLGVIVICVYLAMQGA